MRDRRDQTLISLLSEVKNVKVNYDKRYGKARKKPLLILLVLSMIANEELQNNRIHFNEIEDKLSDLIKRYGMRPIKSANAGADQPFVFLASSQFWELHIAESYRVLSDIKSSSLRGPTNYAKIKDEYFELLSSSLEVVKIVFEETLHEWWPKEYHNEIKHDLKMKEYIVSNRIANQQSKAKELQILKEGKDIEKIIEERILQYKVFGAIDIDEETWIALKDFVYMNFSKGKILELYPLTVCLFLVWAGVKQYKEGNYWPSIFSFLPVGNENKWQQRFGSLFLSVLKKYELPFVITHSNKFIIPILAHGIIPNYYLEPFFDELLSRYLNKQPSEEEIKNILRTAKQEYERMQDYIKKQKEVQDSTEEISKIENIYEKWDLIEKLSEKNEIKIENSEMDYLLEHKEFNLQAEESKIDQLKQIEEMIIAIDELRLKIKPLWEKVFKDSCFSIEKLNLLVEKYYRALERLIEEYIELPVIVKIKEKNYVIRLLVNIVTALRYREENKRKKLIVKKVDDIFSKLGIQTDDNIKYYMRKQKLMRDLFSISSQWVANNKVLRGKIDKHGINYDNFNELQIVRENLNATEYRITKYKECLMAIGKGSFEDGAEILEEQVALREEIETIRESINSDYLEIEEYLQYYEQNLKRLSKDKVKEVIKIENEKIRKKEENINQYYGTASTPFYFLTEGVRVFLFFGEDISINFLYSCINGIEKLKRADNLVGLSVPFLPARVKEELEKWWENKGRKYYLKYKDQQRTISEITIRRPKYYYDEQKGQIILKTLESIKKGTEGEKLENAELTITFENKKPQIYKLKVKSDHFGKIKTEIEQLSDGIEPKTTLKCEFTWGDIYREWEMDDLLVEEPLLLFNTKGYMIKVLKNEDSIWVVAPNTYTLQSSEELVAINRLSGKWKRYTAYYIDIENTDVIAFFDSAGKIKYLKKEKAIKPQLKGGMLAKAGWQKILCEEKNVYIKQLPSLIFNVEEAEDLNKFKVHLLTKKEEVVVQSLELTDYYHANDGICHLVLEDYIKGEYGAITIALVKGSIEEYSEMIVLLPSMKFQFDRNLYIESEGDFGKLEISLDQIYVIDFLPKSPAKKLMKGSLNELIEFPINKILIEGIMEIDSQSIPLSIRVPQISWSLEGGENLIHEKEIWHGDLGQLRFKIPDKIGKRIDLELVLNNGEQRLKKAITKDEVVFDLDVFSDTISNSEKDLLPFHLRIPQFDEDIFMLNVRTKWEVENIIFKQKVEKNMRVIDISWQDKGKPQERMLKVIPIEDGKRTLEYCIPHMNEKLIIKEPLEKLPPGEYKIKFDIDDHWIDFEEIDDDINTRIVTIGTIEEVIKELKKNGLKLDSIVAKQNEIKLQDLGIVISEIEEDVRYSMGGFYRGSFINSQNKGLIGADPSSVYFYLNIEKRYCTYLIDEDEDGMMYCPICHKVIWSLGDDIEHSKRDHVEPEKIKVTLRRAKDEP